MPQDINSVTDKKGLRERLKSMFPLLPTVDERLRFHGWLRFLATRETCSSDQSYLISASTVIVYRVALLVGLPLLGYFIYLAVHGLNPDPYLASLFPDPNEPIRQYGMVGLYAYYYMLIMKYVVLFVGVACFMLFLIHVKRGEKMPPYRGPMALKENRTTQNMIKYFFIGAAVLGLGYAAGAYWYMTLSLVTSYINIVDLQHLSFSGFLFWGAIVFCFGTSFELTGACLIYIALGSMWITALRYDLAYEKQHKNIIT